MLSLDSTTDLCRLLADPTRLRLLSLLEVEALTVAELTRITRLPQPRVSTHLGRLREAGLVRDRRNGASSYYRLDRGALDGEAGTLWKLLSERTRDPLIDDDRGRLREVVAERQTGDRSWAESVAGRMQRHYSPGRTWESLARGVVGLADLGDVVDIASGDGVLAELLAPHARSVTCIDRSRRVLEAARRRIARDPALSSRVHLLRADMHRLPIGDGRFDRALLMSALCYADDPRRALAEAARVLRPGGRLVAVTLERHRHREAVARFDHVQCGHEPARLRAWIEAAGLEVITCEVTSREKRPPHFEAITVHAAKPRTRGDQKETP
jgi:ArsR family transcriptional regulator